MLIADHICAYKIASNKFYPIHNIPVTSHFNEMCVCGENVVTATSLNSITAAQVFQEQPPGLTTHNHIHKAQTELCKHVHTATNAKISSVSFEGVKKISEPKIKHNMVTASSIYGIKCLFTLSPN